MPACYSLRNALSWKHHCRPQLHPSFAVGKKRNGVFIVVPMEETQPPHLHFVAKTTHIADLIDVILVLHLAAPRGWIFLRTQWPVSKSKVRGGMGAGGWGELAS